MAGELVELLSFAQERLWFLDQFEPGKAVYNVPLAWRIQGPLNRHALQDALTALIARHEPFRTVFASIEGRPRQRILPLAHLSLPEIDLRRLPPDERMQTLQASARREACRPFHLSRDLMIRGLLLRVADTEWVFVLTLHHIVADGWSIPILYHELEEAYAASLHGGVPSWPPLPVCYADYARRQREEWTAERLNAEVNWWRRQLDGCPERLELPADFTRRRTPSWHGAWQAIQVPEALLTSLQDFSHREGCSLYMTLLAAWFVLLWRYTGQDDLLVGSPMANRSRSDLDGLIGFFVNTVVLRGDLHGDPPFRELLHRIRDLTLDVYEHQHMPFEKLVEALRPERSPDRSPLFQTMFVFQNPRPQAPKLEGLQLQRMGLETGTAKFDLTLVVEQKQGLEIGVEYRTGLFSRERMQRLLQHYQVLLRGIVAHPQARLHQLPILTAEERLRLRDWSSNTAGYPQCGVHELFEEQARRRPGAVALEWNGGALSYRDLNARANQLARGLRQQGVGLETVVAVGMERSAELIIAMLAILKAGGAYLPFSPAEPARRRNQLLQDAGVTLVLQGAEQRLDLPQALPLFSSADLMQGQADANLGLPAAPEQLACVLATSGSTGTPKGVEILHRGILRLLMAAEYVHLDENEVLLHLSPVSFDAATFEIWGALLHGATCVLYPAHSPTPRELAEILSRHRVSTLWLTASLFHEVVDEAPYALDRVRQLLTGGEPLSVDHVRRVLQSHPRLHLTNCYGPTEATTFTCCYRVPEPPPPDASSIPIGRPIANTEVYVLDQHWQAQPVGVPGELYIGGDGLARGYRHQPAQTAERFIEHPFRTDTRLYRSGDRACWRSDGTLEFLGRTDDQIKLRGYRIELGEIETVLRRHSQIERAAVVVQGDGGRRRLVAYLVVKPVMAGEDLRSYLRSRLPEYMIPAQFVMLDGLPLTPQGKLDRRALPHLAEPAFAPPASPLPRSREEVGLEQIWKSVLDLPSIPSQASFFELGGHSLLAARLLWRIEQTFGVRLTMTSLFEHATLEAMTKLLREQHEVRWLPPMIPIQPQGSRRPFFCVGAGPFFLPLARRLGMDQPFLGIDLSGDHELQPPYCFEEIAAYVVRAIRAQQPEGPYQIGGWCLHGVLAYEAACQLRRQGQEVSTLALFDVPHPSCWRHARIESERLRYYLERARQMSPGEALIYARERLRGARFRLQAQVWQLVYRVCGRTGRSSHAWLRDMLQLLIFTSRNYVPEVYPGTVFLFRSQDRPRGGAAGSDFGWRPLLRERLRICEIPGDHHSMFREPGLSILASELAHCWEAPPADERWTMSRTENGTKYCPVMTPQE